MTAAPVNAMTGAAALVELPEDQAATHHLDTLNTSRHTVAAPAAVLRFTTPRITRMTDQGVTRMSYVHKLIRAGRRILCATLGHTEVWTPMPYLGTHLTYRWAAVTRPYCSTCGAQR